MGELPAFQIYLEHKSSLYCDVWHFVTLEVHFHLRNAVEDNECVMCGKRQVPSVNIEEWKMLICCNMCRVVVAL